MEGIQWFEASDNDDGIKTIAMIDIDKELNLGRTVGYNGILKGDEVMYKEKVYTVVMVSRLGHFGLSDTGKLPYALCVSPSEVTKA
ncbi:hypothetical protein [Bacillus toyonensis]|uniref:hypothetical protein n=1 Tax=Bacillus toyonensis TaxID=155322 RepID=UPI002E250F03|nr:hypothetical protein [Bacillus toyonensis]